MPHTHHASAKRALDLFVALEMVAIYRIVNATKTTNTTSKSVALEMRMDASNWEAFASFPLRTTEPKTTSCSMMTKPNVIRLFVRTRTRQSSQIRCAASEITATKQNARRYKIAAPMADVARCTIRKRGNGNLWAVNVPRNVLLQTTFVKTATQLIRMVLLQSVQRENAAVTTTLNWWPRIVHLNAQTLHA